jgi:hypothetical protein
MGDGDKQIGLSRNVLIAAGALLVSAAALTTMIAAVLVFGFVRPHSSAADDKPKAKDTVTQSAVPANKEPENQLSEEERRMIAVVVRAQGSLKKLFIAGAEIPSLNGDTMKTGQIGCFERIEVLQVLNSSEFLGAVPGGSTVWFVLQKPTDNIVDGRKIYDHKHEKPYVVIGPKTYPTAIGSTRTVMMAAELSVGLALQQAAAESAQ